MRAQMHRASGRRISACMAALLIFAATAASGQTVPVPIPDPPKTGTVQSQPAQGEPELREPAKPADEIPADDKAAERGPAAQPVKATTASKTDPPAVAGPFALRLRDGSRLVGTPSETKTLPFHAAFGRIEIPLSLIKSVAFGPDPASTAVGLHNGDRLTGAVGVERLRFQTAYGTVEVPLATVIGLTSRDAVPKTAPPKTDVVQAPPKPAVNQVDVPAVPPLIAPR
ncbi:MAG: hypothetical protein WD468_08540 [Pirellulales bacterium]